MKETDSEQANRVMRYHDQLEIHKESWSGRELYESLLTLVMDVIQDEYLTEMNTKDLLIQIAEEM